MDGWRLFTENKIREAQETGEFDIPDSHKGKKLDLTENPYVPEDVRLAYKLMGDNGLVPDWVGDLREIRETSAVAVSRLEREHNRFKSTLSKSQGRVDVESIYEREAAHVAWDEALARFKRAATKINKLIETYNLRVPISDLQRLYFNAEREIEKIERGTSAK